jgi:hypothetical protein
MFRTAANRLATLGRVTIVTLSLAVLVGLAAGLGSAVLARNGEPWLLGRPNVATRLTQLGGKQGVNGAMLRITNANAGANDTALDLRVNPSEPPLRVNSTTKVSGLHADLIDGFSVGCAAGKRLIAGLCYDENPRPANTVTNASDDCHDLGGHLPTALQIRAIRSEPGIDLGTGDTGHWTADIAFIGAADPPNNLVSTVVVDNGGLQLVDDQQLRPFRCVYQPLLPN